MRYTLSATAAIALFSLSAIPSADAYTGYASLTASGAACSGSISPLYSSPTPVPIEFVPLSPSTYGPGLGYNFALSGIVSTANNSPNQSIYIILFQGGGTVSTSSSAATTLSGNAVTVFTSIAGIPTGYIPSGTSWNLSVTPGYAGGGTPFSYTINSIQIKFANNCTLNFSNGNVGATPTPN